MNYLQQERTKLSQLYSPTVEGSLSYRSTENSIIDDSVLTEVLKMFLFSLKPRKCHSTVKLFWFVYTPAVQLVSWGRLHSNIISLFSVRISNACVRTCSSVFSCTKPILSMFNCKYVYLLYLCFDAEINPFWVGVIMNALHAMSALEYDDFLQV